MKRGLALAAVLAFGLASFTTSSVPDPLNGDPAIAQGSTEVCITAPGRDCQGRCMTQECSDEEARAQAEADRRAGLTPEQRAAEDARLRSESDAKRAQAEAGRRAAEERVERQQREQEAQHKARIDAQMKQFGMGESRRAEAERLNAMREAAEAARPKQYGSAPLVTPPAPASGRAQGPSCKSIMQRQTMSGFFSYKNLADAQTQALSWCSGHGEKNCRIKQCTSPARRGDSFNCVVGYDLGMVRHCEPVAGSKVLAQ